MDEGSGPVGENSGGVEVIEAVQVGSKQKAVVLFRSAG